MGHPSGRLYTYELLARSLRSHSQNRERTLGIQGGVTFLPEPLLPRQTTLDDRKHHHLFLAAFYGY
jgi:hypothetical protein